MRFLEHWPRTPMLILALLVIGGAEAQPTPGSGMDSVARPDMKLDAAQRSHLIATLAQKMRANYVFPEVAEKMATAILAQDKRGDYAKDGSANALSEHLTNDLQKLSMDKHIRLRYWPDVLPEDIPEADRAKIKPSAAERERDLAKGKYYNFGVEKFERLPGNIGYLELKGFLEPEYSGEAIASAMTLVADSKALIIDVRRNGGGDPATVALVSSYLFDSDPVHLNDLYYRWDGQIHQYWTQAWVPGKRFGPNKPVYVLTSPRTFSAAEEFANNLKTLKRATIVGATTGGGANPGGVFKLAEHVGVFIPTGRAINPITKSNWEGTGVVPDVAVPHDQALLTAQVLAMQPVVAAMSDPWRKEEATKVLVDLKAKLDALKTIADK